jgi:CheY-like chemotaxis protein
VQAHNNSPAARPRLNVFVADDEVDTIMTLAAILRDEGHTVQTCASGSLALGMVERYQPDVCILDISMPLKNGFDLARDIRNLQLPRRPVLIAVSGVYTRPSEQLLARSVGYDHFMVKPTDPRELIAVLETLTGAEPRRT